MNAACGWAVAQMDFDGGDELWYGVGRVVPVFLVSQRTIKTDEIRALKTALCKLCGW